MQALARTRMTCHREVLHQGHDDTKVGRIIRGPYLHLGREPESKRILGSFKFQLRRM